jgi:hypothetical protein
MINWSWQWWLMSQWCLELCGPLRESTCHPDKFFSACTTSLNPMAHCYDPHKRFWQRKKTWQASLNFEVFMTDFEGHLWAEEALFLRLGCSRDVRVSPYDLSWDCIMFLDDYANWLWKKTTKPYVVHDMKHEKVYYSPSPKVPWVSGKVPAPLTWIFSQGTHFHSFFLMHALAID